MRGGIPAEVLQAAVAELALDVGVRTSRHSHCGFAIETSSITWLPPCRWTDLLSPTFICADVSCIAVSAGKQRASRITDKSKSCLIWPHDMTPAERCIK